MPASEALTMASKLRTKKYIEHKGKTLTLNGWAKELGVCRSTIEKRLKEHPTEVALGAGFRGINVANEKAVIQLTKGGEFIAEHKSMSEAGRQTGVDFKLISATLKGKQNTAGGFRWKRR